MNFFFRRIFPLPFIIAGVATSFFGFRDLQRARASTTWPTAQGIIQDSSVEYHTDNDGAGTYHAEVWYRFTVKETTFSGNRVAFGDYSASNPSHAQSIVNRYPKGKPVTVYHHPENPKLCILEPGVKGQVWLVPGFGLVFFTAGSLMAIFLPKAMRKQVSDASPAGR